VRVIVTFPPTLKESDVIAWVSTGGPLG